VGRRLTRKQIKQDEFISIIDEWMHWLGSNWKQAALGLGGAVLVLLIVLGGKALLGGRSDAAGAALGQALQAYNAPVGKDAPADAKVKYATDPERLDAAEKAFKEVTSKYWLTKEATLARLFLARIAADRGDKDRAIKELTELVAKRSDDPVIRLAMLALVNLRLEKGEGAQLVPELEAMAAGSDPRLSRDVALYQLGQVWDRQGKPDEAKKAYRKLVDEFPESPFKNDAQEHLGAAS
jgi:predicted negative regulator of RcsB-dependent stress response